MSEQHIRSRIYPCYCKFYCIGSCLFTDKCHSLHIVTYHYFITSACNQFINHKPCKSDCTFLHLSKKKINRIIREKNNGIIPDSCKLCNQKFEYDMNGLEKICKCINDRCWYCHLTLADTNAEYCDNCLAPLYTK